MPSTIYLIRHAESAHNVTKDFSLRDPGLTSQGFTQASSLATSFPALASTAVILTSPLRRTIETTLAGFGGIISNTNNKKKAVELILDPNLQERSDLPCDTGSDPSALKSLFPDLDFGVLADGWWAKEGRFTADDAAVAARAGAVRKRIGEVVRRLEAGGGENDKRDVVVVTHGVFMKFLTGDEGIDLPKAGWKAFTLGEGQGEGEVVLVPV
jgi:broad specificity phosphatase PhoE